MMNSSQKYPAAPILLVDDEEDILAELAKTLQYSGINNIIQCNDSRQVLNILRNSEISVISLDLWMPFVSGRELLTEISRLHSHIPVFILTGNNDIDTAIECMKIGAKDYLLKPVERTDYINRIKKLLEIYELQLENRYLTQHILSGELKNHEAFSEIVTTNNQMKLLFKYIEAIADSSSPVLITGESGVGKELMAKAIHTVSKKEKKMITVNVAGLDDTLFSDTLFGHKRGAFTGADQVRSGLIEKAQGSTLFLDEIGDLEPNSQIKLLRLLQEREYYKLGSDVIQISYARVITSTCIDLKENMEKKKFRQDLYYRLNTHHIHIPSLRERPGDIPLLIEYFINKSKQDFKNQDICIPSSIIKRLSLYHFPGNVRELQTIVNNLVSLCKMDTMSMELVDNYFKQNNILIEKSKLEKEDIIQITTRSGNLPKLNEMEEFLVKKAMEISNDNQTVAAPLVGLTQSALSKRLAKIKYK